MQLIPDLTGYEEAFGTELQESHLICFVQLTFPISNLLTKRLDVTVSVLRHERTTRNSRERVGERSEIGISRLGISHANTIDSGVTPVQ
jgi:hypothetical protein